MRIVLASFSSLPETVGGGEVHAYQLARALNRAGHIASLLTVEKTGRKAVQLRQGELEGVHIDYLTLPSCNSIYDREPGLIQWAKSWFRDEGVDILHLFIFNHLLGLIPAANDSQIPVCLTALEFSYFCRRYDLMYEGSERCELNRRGRVCEQCVLSTFSPRQQRAARMARIVPAEVERRLRFGIARFVGDRLPSLAQRSVTKQIETQRRNLPRELAAIITPSTIMRNFYLAQGVEAAKLHFIPYGSDIQERGSNGHNGRNGKIRVGYIGRIDPKKGVDVLCEAICMLPKEVKIELNIFGPLDASTGSYQQTIRTLAASDSRIRLRGKLDRAQLPQAYREIDVLAVPSIWYENSPIAISEALSLGCPVICSDTTGFADLIKHEQNGLTFPAGDRHALSNSLKKLVDDPGLLVRLRRQVRPVETSEQIATQLLRVYQQIRS